LLLIHYRAVGTKAANAPSAVVAPSSVAPPIEQFAADVHSQSKLAALTPPNEQQPEQRQSGRVLLAVGGCFPVFYGL